jgi:hypothetical protein
MLRFVALLALGAGIAAPDGGNQITVSTGPSAGTWVTMPDCRADGGNALNYNNSTKAFACGATTSARVLNSNSAVVGNIGAGEDTLMSYTLPGGTLAEGRVVRVSAFGLNASTANAKTLRLYFGSTLIEGFVLNTGTADSWSYTATVMRTGAATQASNVIFVYRNAAEATATTPTETLASDVLIKVTGQAVDNNDITQLGMIVELL